LTSAQIGQATPAIPGSQSTSDVFSDRADTVKYLDELIVRFKGNRGREEQEERWWIREAGVVTR
jgi:hypothetical protein